MQNLQMWDILFANLATRRSVQVWSCGAEHFDTNRLKRYSKKHAAEVASCMVNLQRAIGLLNEGLTIEEICRLSFFGSEGEDVYRIGQSGVKHAKETRLYIYVRIIGERIELLTIGGKETQPDDIKACKVTARKLKAEQEVQDGQQENQ